MQKGAKMPAEYPYMTVRHMFEFPLTTFPQTKKSEEVIELDASKSGFYFDSTSSSTDRLQTATRVWELLNDKSSSSWPD